jgi:uncharacterized membrane protein
LDHAGNNLIIIFLRKLEYYKGIMILTINYIKDFNDAMQSRIYIAIRYLPLGIDMRQGLWASFLGKAIITNKMRFSSDDFNKLIKWELNG